MARHATVGGIKWDWAFLDDGGHCRLTIVQDRRFRAHWGQWSAFARSWHLAEIGESGSILWEAARNLGCLRDVKKAIVARLRETAGKDGPVPPMTRRILLARLEQMQIGERIEISPDPGLRQALYYHARKSGRHYATRTREQACFVRREL